MKQTTLWIIIKDGKIFLWEKKRWFAKWVLNGIWGKSEENESIEDCMIREAYEEIWITIDKINLEFIWILHFEFSDFPDWNQDVNVFIINNYSWKIIETEEIKPFWFDLDNIPYDKMWADDIYWLPRVLNWEKWIEYKFWFDKDNWKIIKQEKIK